MELSIVLCTLTSLLVALAVAWRPLVKMDQENFFTTENETHRFDPKVALLESIAELEQDFSLGHLDKEAFERMSLELKREFLETKQSDTKQS
ncbi:MAG: c-type cytochrome biogenesis protein CcmI [SAR324 cluster bacterium]|nr:c-type cytochrome biogenesis protein CcmI [SAR324 cluster bacterium]